MLEFKKSFNHNIEIVPTANGGAVARIGCCTLVYSKDELVIMASDLREYLQNPEEVTKRYHQMDERILGPAPTAGYAEACDPS